jgi:hypothetical protein
MSIPRSFSNRFSRPQEKFPDVLKKLALRAVFLKNFRAYGKIRAYRKNL